MKTRIIPRQSNDQILLSYQKALIVYEITGIFCNRFLNCRDRTVDQMTQAARYAKLNIMKGWMVPGVSREVEEQRIRIARSRLNDLLEDFHDYLRTHRGRVWTRDSPEAVHMRKIGRGLPNSKNSVLELVRTRKAPVICNIAICLIHQINGLMDQPINESMKKFPSQKRLRVREDQVRRLVR